VLQRLLFISILLYSTPRCHAFIKHSDINEKILNLIKDNKPYATSDVDSYEKNEIDYQTLKLSGAAYHQQSCVNVFKVLGNYENYYQMISFIKKSIYREKTQRVFFLLSHFLLPFDMIMDFIIPRIKKEGQYEFIFDRGFLKNLKGEINVEDLNDNKYRCFISLEINWDGKESPFPDFIFQYFSKVLLKKSISNLWMKSGHHF